jgi:hypothetical protein
MRRGHARPSHDVEIFRVMPQGFVSIFIVSCVAN